MITIILDKKIPKPVLSIVRGCDAWLVGGAITDDEPKDWDVVVPYEEWNQAKHFIPEDATPTKFGGWEFTESGVEIDVWPSSLHELITNPQCHVIYHPNTDSLYARQENLDNVSNG